MSTFFKPYEGRRPYVFISYSHRDSDRVLGILSALNAQKLRLWYDEGIPAGSDWPKNIELHMRECAAVLFFLSKTALASPNCYSEIRTAVETGKPLLIVPLEETEPDENWTALFRGADRLSLQDGAAPEAIRSRKMLRRSFYRRWTDSFRREWIGLSAALLLFAAAAIGVVALMQGRFDPPDVPDPTPFRTSSPSQEAAHDETAAPSPTPSIDPGVFPVRFPDSQQEQAVRDVLGRDTGDVLRPELAAVTELYFCGNQVTRSMDGVRFTPDGQLTINGAKILLSGRVEDLSLIGSMVFLEKLALVDQPVGSLAPLSGLTLLTELYLSGTELSDLSALTGLPRLEILHLEHTNVRDLTPLEALPSLRTVTVSADMLPLDWTEDKPFQVILIP